MADVVADYTIKQNDWGEREPLRAILEQLVVDPETGEPILDGENNLQWEPVDLTNCTVRMLIESEAKARVKTGPMTGWDGGALTDDGKVEYQFQKAEGADPADLAVAALYKMEFQITGPGEEGVQSIPNAGYNTLRVEADLGPDS